MTKAEIATEIARTTGLDKAGVITVIEQFMTVVKDSLAHGDNVYLRGFGSFIIKERAEKLPATSQRTLQWLSRPIRSRLSNRPRSSWKRSRSELKL